MGAASGSGVGLIDADSHVFGRFGEGARVLVGVGSARANVDLPETDCVRRGETPWAPLYHLKGWEISSPSGARWPSVPGEPFLPPSTRNFWPGWARGW